MNIYKLILISFLFFNFGYDLYSQTYVTPYLGVTYYEVSNYENKSLQYPEFANKDEKSFGFGILIEQKVAKRLSLLMNLDFEKLGVKSTWRLLRGSQRESISPSVPIPTEYIHNRYSLGLGLEYTIVNNLSISYINRLVRTPTIKFKFLPGAPTILKRKKQPSDLLEYAHRIELKYRMKNVSIIGYYTRAITGISNQNLTNENNLANSVRIDSGKSFGIKVGYRFKVLGRLERNKKTKVDCPSF